eukprot:2364298-Rhodomonas_salina.2
MLTLTSTKPYCYFALRALGTPPPSHRRGKGVPLASVVRLVPVGGKSCQRCHLRRMPALDAASGATFHVHMFCRAPMRKGQPLDPH